MTKNNKKIYNLLFESEVTPDENVRVKSADVKARKALDSIDDQIDALLLKYESSSIREEDKLKGLDESTIEHSLNNTTLKYLLHEAPGDEAEAEAAEDPAAGAEGGGEEAPGDEGGEAPDTVGSEKMDVTKAGEEEVPDLDIDAFAMRTVRLIMNYKNLLRVEEAIINRIKNFLNENYGDKFVTSYIEILEDQYGISVNEFEDERDTEDTDFAVGAFAGGTGGLGGGGG